MVPIEGTINIGCIWDNTLRPLIFYRMSQDKQTFNVDKEIDVKEII